MLVRENAALRGQLAVANTRIAELVVEGGRLGQLMAASNERVTELLAIAQRNQRKKKKKTPKAPQLLATVSDHVREAFENRPPPPELPKKKKRAKEKQRPTGRKPVPDHLPAEEHTRRPECCGGCGGAELDLVDEVVETKLHVVKAHQRRRVVRRKTVCCRACGTRTTARSLPSPFARSKATCEWLAWLRLGARRPP